MDSPKEQMPNSAMMDSLSRWILDYYSHPPKHSSHPGDWQFFQLDTDDVTMWRDLRRP